MKLTLTPLADANVTVLPPDIVWLRADGQRAGPGEFGVVGDFRVSVDNATGGIGGFEAANPIRTATLLLLFSDCRVEDYELRNEHGGDHRGYPGDGFDVDTGQGEQALGSKLWLYRRSTLSDQIGREVAAEAGRALTPLLKQGAVARIDTDYALDFDSESLRLTIDMYGRDGEHKYSDKFDIFWRRSDGGL